MVSWYMRVRVLNKDPLDMWRISPFEPNVLNVTSWLMQEIDVAFDHHRVSAHLYRVTSSGVRVTDMFIGQVSNTGSDCLWSWATRLDQKHG